ncbi:MAG: aminotransferase class V-fold PLP-dependent enzyme [Planctomycetota bacterium]
MSDLKPADQRIYFDHAATSWPKPPGVVDAVCRYMNEEGATAGRGAYRSARRAGELLLRTRIKLAGLIGLSADPMDSNCISFHSSGTAALNSAIDGLVRPNDCVVTTAADHNSVLRPLHRLANDRNVDLRIVTCDQTGLVKTEDVLNAAGSDADWVIITSASNVTGAIQPIEEIAEKLKAHRARLIVDAAQTLGAKSIDVTTGVDALAAPLHKCVGGPAGTAMLYLAPSLHDSIRPLIVGGTGTASESLVFPVHQPDAMESGNLNVPAIAGVEVAVDRILERGLDQIEQDNRRICDHLTTALPSAVGRWIRPLFAQLPTFSLVPFSLPPAETAAVLDSEYGIEVRSGYHCAALVHQALLTNETGTLRISASAETTEAEIETLCAALADL